MSTWFNRLNVLRAILSNQSRDCPYCNSTETKRIGSNAPLSHVRRCDSCQLMYRWPRQDEHFNQHFYQNAYAKVHHSLATDLPTEEQVDEFKRTLFARGPRNFSSYIELMNLLNRKSVLDYGCSWGYGVYQFRQAGFGADGFEVSSPRASFGCSALGVTIFNDEQTLLATGKTYDCIFTSHVLEHLPTPRIAFDFIDRILLENGLLIIEVPNCGGANARKEGVKWGPFSSSLHPLSYTLGFFETALPRHGYQIRAAISRPFDPAKVVSLTTRENHSQDCPEGDNLVVIAQRKPAQNVL